MKYRWLALSENELTANHLSKSLGISKILSQILLNRGVQNVEKARLFLKPQLKNLSDPFLLPDMDKAVKRLLYAYENDECVVIFGDYDVDGVTSTAFLYDFLKRLGFNAYYYLPNRLDEGYGLSRDGIKNCLEKYPAKLIIAVDCGTSAVNVIEELRKDKIDVIVLDHHQIPSKLPEAFALVNPLLAKEKQYAENIINHKSELFCELCSVGIVFKVAHAFLKEARKAGIKEAFNIDIRRYLDLVALGTIADMSPLTGENRILVSSGLKKLNSAPAPGLASLISISSTRKPVGVHEVGFQLAPRLNAAGRLETAEEAFRLLLAESSDEAIPLAQRLDAKNRERQTIEHKIFEEAIDIITKKFNPDEDYVIVEANPEWHIGVVGIVASRVLQQFYRPTIILGGDGEHLRGSCRSIDGFDIAVALRKCADILVKYGGHSMAAGVTIEPEKVHILREKLNEIARQTLQDDDLKPYIQIDMEVKLSDLTFNLMEQLERLEPFGNENPETIFLVKNLRHHRPFVRIGSERQHIKMWVTDDKQVLEALWWNAGNNNSLPVGRFDLVFIPEINEFNNQRSIILNVIDWRKSGEEN